MADFDDETISASGSVLIREASRDTTLSVPMPAESKGSREVFIRKGTIVNIDMVGVRECFYLASFPISYHLSQSIILSISPILKSSGLPAGTSRRLRTCLMLSQLLASVRIHTSRTFSRPSSLTYILEGPRACIGRKFATTEAVCWLTMLLRDFKVEVPLLPDETAEAARNRILQAQLVMTLQVDPVPIRLVRRSTQ